MNQRLNLKMTQPPKNTAKNLHCFCLNPWLSMMTGFFFSLFFNVTSHGAATSTSTEQPSTLSYISDSLPIKLYSHPLLSPNENASILGEMVQGDAVTFMETNENQTWVKIKTASGLEGWLKKEWIQTHQSARAQASELQTQLNHIQNALLEKNQRIHTLQQEIMRLKNEAVGDAPPNITTTHGLHPLQPQPTSSIPTSDSEIHKQLETSRILNEELKLENHVLRENQYTQGLIHGTISLLLGVLLAIVLPKIKPKKRHENWG
jgi:SH3 domain protein